MRTQQGATYQSLLTRTTTLERERNHLVMQFHTFTAAGLLDPVANTVGDPAIRDRELFGELLAIGFR